ncbi:hypothetical protein E3O86_RS12210 [Enterococcus hirae]
MIENNMSKEELYNHLNFSKDQIAEDQNKEPYKNIVVNEHVFLVDIISTYRNKFSQLPNKVKLPSKTIDNIHQGDPIDKLLCLYQGKLYFIENLDPQKGEKKAYVIAEDVEYINGELTQGSKEKNSYQNLIGPVEMENNPSKDAQSLFVHSRVVYDIIKKDNEYKKAKKAERTARTITEPNATYIGENLKIGIPQRTSSDLSVNVQLMVHKGKLYQLDTESSKSKLLADNIEEKEGIYYKRNSQGLRVDLFSPSNVTTVDTNNFIQRRWTREGKNRDRTATMYVDSLTLEEINQRLNGFKMMEDRQQIKSKPWIKVDVRALSSLSIPKNQSHNKQKDLFYYKEGTMRDKLYKLEIESQDGKNVKIKNAYLLADKDLYNSPNAKHIAVQDWDTNVKINLFLKSKMSNGFIWIDKGEVEKNINYLNEAKKHFPKKRSPRDLHKPREHENRNVNSCTLLLNKNNLYLVSHKGKKAILITDNAHFQDGKLKLGDKVIADKLPKTSNKDAMIWSLSAENATKFLDIANINNFVQGRNLIDLTTPAKASHELGTSNIIQDSKSLEDLTGYTQPLPERRTSNIAQGRNSLSNLIDLTTHAKASHEPSTSHIIQDSKSLEDLTGYTQLLPERSTSNIAQGRNSLSNLIDLTTHAKASHELSSNIQSNTVGHTQKRSAPQPPQKGSNEAPSR